MSIQTQVLARAASRIGYYAPNDPKPGSEAGRYWTAKGKGAWLSGPSIRIWWCMLFVSMCLDEVGQINAIGGFSFNTDTTIRQARAAGCQFVTVAQASPGDIVIFNWDGGGTDHVGFVEKNLGGGRLQTIEGNTSSGAKGSQSAGNGVWRRIRSASIACIIRPNYTGNTTSAPSNSISASSEKWWWGPKVTTMLQAYFGTPQDGTISNQPQVNRPYVPCAGQGWEWSARVRYGSTVIEALQNRIQASPDGLFGPKSVAALQRHLGIPVDGYAGSQTCEALYKAIVNKTL